MSCLEAVEQVLTDRGEPTHYREITQVALDSGSLQTKSQRPEATVYAQIYAEIKKHGDLSTFVRAQSGFFGLRRWLEEGTLHSQAVPDSIRSMVPHFPDYDKVRKVLPVWVGAPADAITRMQNAIWAQTGTPQDQMDWSEPDVWIQELLEEEAEEWASKTWLGTEKTVSPRYTTGHWLLARNFDLLQADRNGCLELTPAGEDFIQNPEGKIARSIDSDQGLLRVLRIVAEAGSATPAELLEPWTNFLRSETKVRAESSSKSHLSHRMRNLLQRDYLERNGRSYSIAQAGLGYLEGNAKDLAEEEPEADLGSEIRRLQEELRQQVREGIKDLLHQMDPYAFEQLVQRLLDAMEYQDTQTTSRASDGGVDVLGRIKVGISEIKEVVQVKRQRTNVGRPVLDGLRGALYRFDAVQGTVITTGGFTKEARAVAFDRGAPPITLIDGDSLVGLLIEHGIGVAKRKIEIWSLDPEAFVGELGEPS